MAKVEELKNVFDACQEFTENFAEHNKKLAQISQARNGSDVYADPKQLNYKTLGSANDEFSSKIEGFMKQLDHRSLDKMAKEQVNEVLTEVRNNIHSAA